MFIMLLEHNADDLLFHSCSTGGASMLSLAVMEGNMSGCEGIIQRLKEGKDSDADSWKAFINRVDNKGRYVAHMVGSDTIVGPA